MLSDDDMALAAGWGYRGQGGAVMPGQGKRIMREYQPDEMQALAAGAAALGLAASEVQALLGESTVDVWLNGDAWWANIPLNVWRYQLGGYQVIKKWLSYREKDVLGRNLKPDEVEYVTSMARRIAAILLLGPALDANFQIAKRAASNVCAGPP